MNTKHFPLNLQSGSTLSILRNFRGGGVEPPQPPPPGMPLCPGDLKHNVPFLLLFESLNMKSLNINLDDLHAKLLT